MAYETLINRQDDDGNWEKPKIKCDECGENATVVRWRGNCLCKLCLWRFETAINRATGSPGRGLDPEWRKFTQETQTDQEW